MKEIDAIMDKKHLLPHAGVASLSSPLEVGADKDLEAAGRLENVLQKSGCKVLNLGRINTPRDAVAAGTKAAEAHVDVVALTPVCWFEDYLVLDLIEECPAPILLWPLPGMESGALCGTQQLTCYLKQLEHPFFSVFGEIENNDISRRAVKYMKATALKKRLRRSRIGFSGQHINGMTHTAPNEIMLKKSIGARVVSFGLPELIHEAGEIPEVDAASLWRKVVENAARCNVAEKDGLDSMRIYAVLKKIIEKEKLDAFTIGCYPSLMGRVCLASSMLADEGVPFACEGDINGAVGQLILTLLTEQPTHNTDWLEPLEDGTVIFAHCGSGSFSLAEHKKDITLDSVRIMGQGVCALFTAKPGPVTLVSLMPHPDGYQCALLEGEALSTEMVFPGNPVRVRFNHCPETIIEWIFDNGIAHHWMIGYGHVGEEIRHWAEIQGKDLKLIELA